MPTTTYKDAGVDIKKADDVLNRIKHNISSTFNPFVLNTIGGFAAATEIPKGYTNPVMVSSTDGVGTKLKIAFNANKHDSVGIDLVAMSVNFTVMVNTILLVLQLDSLKRIRLLMGQQSEKAMP